MPGFPKPRFEYSIDVSAERRHLRAQKKARNLPDRDDEHLLLATWNIANLGAKEQTREPECFELIAAIVEHFDLVAVQEVRDDVDAGIRRVCQELPDSWDLIFSETGGNDERMAFLWDSKVIDRGQMVGKVTFEPDQLPRAGGEGFLGFSRTPYIGTFHCGELALMIVSAHSYFGDPRDPIDMGRRLAETKALAWWCERAVKDPQAYTPDVLAVGDMNTPSEDDMELATKMLDELRRRGLYAPRYEDNGQEQVLETQLGTAVRSENHYDQLLFVPKNTESDLTAHGVFDFDATIFPDLWESRGRTDFHRFVIWAVSDHRPLWGQFKVPG